MFKRLSVITTLVLVVSLVAGCATPAAPAVPTAAGKVLKLVAIFPGTITDADYNTLGYNGIKAVEKSQGIKIAYSENVAVPDVERVMREYLNDGYNIIFTHGSQFISQTQTMATQFKDAYFIAETDGPVDNAPANLWIVDRNFHLGFYAVGALAARQTQTKKIGYIGGLTLPFAWSELHAMNQAIKDSGQNVKLTQVFTGNFNDPAKARELAEAMIADGVDVIAGSLNLGMLGIFEAVKGKKVTVIAKYTDKSSFAPDNYITSLIYDFEKPLNDIVSGIKSGKSGGYYPLGFDTGVKLQSPLKLVTPEVAKATEQVMADVVSGKIKVVKNTEAIK